jgi:hypothetical protein
MSRCGLRNVGRRASRRSLKVWSRKFPDKMRISPSRSRTAARPTSNDVAKRSGKVRKSTGARCAEPHATSSELRTIASTPVNSSGKFSRSTIPNIITEVVDGLLTQMESAGDGLLPLVLALNPRLSAPGLREDDPEFDRAGRAQSAAEMRFFKEVRPALRIAIAIVLNDAISTARATPVKRTEGVV